MRIAISVAATTLSRLITFWCQVLIGYPLINLVGLKKPVANSLKKDGSGLKMPSVIQPTA